MQHLLWLMNHFPLPWQTGALSKQKGAAYEMQVGAKETGK